MQFQNWSTRSSVLKIAAVDIGPYSRSYVRFEREGEQDPFLVPRAFVVVYLQSMVYFPLQMNFYFIIYRQHNPHGGHYGGMRKAPSNRITDPFNMGFSKICTTNRPNSSGFPNRLGHGTVAPNSFCTASGNPSSSGVLNNPGACVFLRESMNGMGRNITIRENRSRND